MIVCKELPTLQFTDKDEMLKALIENKSEIIATKKMQTKEADSVSFAYTPENDKGEAIKSEGEMSDIYKLRAKLVINTTNLLDSHGDVHVKGIWNKTVKENKSPYLLQEHVMKFDHIITDEVKASVKEMSWGDLGANYNGTTEALVFDVVMNKKRNEYMFEQYANGYVKNHSVGMRYVKMDLAVNSSEKWAAAEKEIWDKYIDQVVNRKEAEAVGYMWIVQEAKMVEGSAVVKGSNHITPTISVEAVKNTSTKTVEPSIDTQKKHSIHNFI